MKGKLAIVCSFIGMFNLGLYTASEFKFNTPIEWYRWLITSFVTLAFMAYARHKANKGTSITWNVFVNKKSKKHE